MLGRAKATMPSRQADLDLNQKSACRNNQNKRPGPDHSAMPAWLLFRRLRTHTVPLAIHASYSGGCRRAAALSDHSMKAARYATKYQLIGRLLGGYLGKLISGPTDPNAGARSIAPHDAPGLRFRHTAVDACLVAVGAFYQTRRKPMSLPL
jgi:hypothetical protein